MSTDLIGALDARLEKVKQELADIGAKKRAAVAPFEKEESELRKQRDILLDIKRDAGLLPPKKPMGNPGFRKKKTT